MLELNDGWKKPIVCWPEHRLQLCKTVTLSISVIRFIEHTRNVVLSLNNHRQLKDKYIMYLRPSTKHLTNSTLFREYPKKEANKTSVWFHLASRLDSSNILLHALQKTTIHVLQCWKNTANRTIIWTQWETLAIIKRCLTDVDK